MKKVRRGMVMAWWLVLRGVFGRAGGVGRRCSNARGDGGGGGCDVAMREGDFKLSRWLALRGIDRLIVNKPRRQLELVPCCVRRGRRKKAGADFGLTQLPDWECQEIRSIADIAPYVIFQERCLVSCAGNCNQCNERSNINYSISAFMATTSPGARMRASPTARSPPSSSTIRYSSSTYNGLVARYVILSGMAFSVPPPADPDDARVSLHRSKMEMRFSGPCTTISRCPSISCAQGAE